MRLDALRQAMDAEKVPQDREHRELHRAAAKLADAWRVKLGFHEAYLDTMIPNFIYNSNVLLYILLCLNSQFTIPNIYS